MWLRSKSECWELWCECNLLWVRWLGIYVSNGDLLKVVLIKLFKGGTWWKVN